MKILGVLVAALCAGLAGCVAVPQVEIGSTVIALVSPAAAVRWRAAPALPPEPEPPPR